jgi:hypothetical protein
MNAVSEWDDEYARLSRAAAQLRTVSNHPSNGAGSTSYQQQVQSLQSGLTRLNSRLASMQASNQMSSDIAAQRKGLVDNLIRQFSSPGTSNTVPRSAMHQALQHQDLLIDDLAKGVSNLKGQTKMIHEETNLHNRLLDDIDNDVEAARIGLENETARARKLTEQTRFELCKLYVYIIALSLLLFLLILAGLS